MENTLHTEINKLIGNYTFKSPYHKNKRLPFNVLGNSFNKERELSVYTVEYKGWNKNDIYTDYKLSDVKSMIDSGFLKIKRIRK